MRIVEGAKVPPEVAQPPKEGAEKKAGDLRELRLGKALSVLCGMRALPLRKALYLVQLEGEKPCDCE